MEERKCDDFFYYIDFIARVIYPDNILFILPIYFIARVIFPDNVLGEICPSGIDRMNFYFQCYISCLKIKRLKINNNYEISFVVNSKMVFTCFFPVVSEQEILHSGWSVLRQLCLRL